MILVTMEGDLPSRAALVAFSRFVRIVCLGVLALSGTLLALQNARAETKPLTTAATYAGSTSCRECHPRFYELWATSFHGLALQPYTPELARTKLMPQTGVIRAGAYAFRAELSRGAILEIANSKTNEYPIVQVAGGKNVFYFMTRLDRGRLQVLPVAYDVRRKEWFDTTASAMRHFSDRLDQALYWKDRQLTFNTSCYNCHVSQLSKNYTLSTDSYDTSWAEPGINCETCHGPSADHVALASKLSTNAPAPSDMKIVSTLKMTISQRNDLCSPCHAKMSPITDSFGPGQRFFDHFDLVTYEQSDFYPDGRDLGENYTLTSWMRSPCAKSGQLDCVHCHTSSGRYRFAGTAKANDACLPCHNERVADSRPHTYHKDGSVTCVSCHMPTTEFARMRRSDHSMLPPTPSVTLQFQSPNACGNCHTNGAAWADKQVRSWHAKDYQKPVLEFASLIASARKQDWVALPRMLDALSHDRLDEIQTVSIVRLLQASPEPVKWPVLRGLLATHRSPLVRAAVAEALGQQLDKANVESLLPALRDEYRLVRVRAAAALAGYPEDRMTGEDANRLRKALGEHIASLQSRPDDMAAHYNLGNFHMARGQMTNAVEAFKTAIRLQPDALPPYVNISLAYNSLGRNSEAEAALRMALRLDPTNSAAALNLGMLLAEMEKPAEAEEAFRSALRHDPGSAQAAYNLGVLVSAKDPKEGLRWCRKAAELRPSESKYATTAAFFEVQSGDFGAAELTLVKCIQSSTLDPQVYAMLGQIYEREHKIADAVRNYERAAGISQFPEAFRAQCAERAQKLKSNQ